MLRQVGILDQKNQLHYIDLSPALSTLMVENNPEELYYYPLSGPIASNRKKGNPWGASKERYEYNYPMAR